LISGCTGEHLIEAFVDGIQGKKLKDAYDPGQISGMSTPPDPGTTQAAGPAIDPAVRALYQAQGFNVP